MSAEMTDELRQELVSSVQQMVREGQAKEAAANKWNDARSKATKILFDQLETQRVAIPEVGQKITVFNFDQKRSKSWNHVKLREIIRQVAPKVEKRIWPRVIRIQCDDPETMDRLIKYLRRLKKELAKKDPEASFGASETEDFSENILDALITAEVLTHKDLGEAVNYGNPPAPYVRLFPIQKNEKPSDDEEPFLVI